MEDVVQLFDKVDQNREAMVDTWKLLVDRDCGSGNKAGVDGVGRDVKDFLEKCGFKVWFHEYEKAGNMLVAEYGDASKPFIILTGHMDTVFGDGTAAARPFTIKDGKVTGPGVLDMKGGVCILLSTLEALHAAGFDDFPCKVILVADEEPAHVFSNAPEVIEKESKGAKCAFNFETGFPDHALVVQRKGCWRFFIETFGRGCHVGNDPQNGRSAILEMAHKIIEIENLTDYSKQYNVNVGTIKGGTVANAAPAHCKVECDFRYVHPEDLPILRKKVEEVCAKQYVPDVTTKLYDSVGFAVMPQLPGNLELLKIAQEVAEESGFPVPGPKLCGGGSDAAYTEAAGVPTLCGTGVEGSRNHTVEEWADVDSLFRRAKQMAGILLKLNEK